MVAVSLFGVGFFGPCFVRGGGFVVSACFFRFFELVPRDSRWAQTPNGALKWNTRNHRHRPVEEDGLGNLTLII